MTTSAVMGVDAGSREVKIVVAGPEGILFTTSVDTIQFYLACRNGGKELDLARLKRLDSAPAWGKVVATGYGRNNLAIKGGQAIPEIMAHAKGAVHQTGISTFTLLDMGGQDIKVASVKDGMVDDFIMNDKCAAGSGRYLENITYALGADLQTLGECWEEPARLSATCAIFGESEVVGMVSDGVPVTSILAGANASVVARLKPMLMRFKPRVIVATGGVARNQAVMKLLETEAGVEVVIPKEPQLNGAIGCVYSQAAR